MPFCASIVYGPKYPKIRVLARSHEMRVHLALRVVPETADVVVARPDLAVRAEDFVLHERPAADQTRFHIVCLRTRRGPEGLHRAGHEERKDRKGRKEKPGFAVLRPLRSICGRNLAQLM